MRFSRFWRKCLTYRNKQIYGIVPYIVVTSNIEFMIMGSIRIKTPSQQSQAFMH